MALTSTTDIDFTGVTIKSGYVRIESYADAAHPTAKRVHIHDSSITQSYRNGDFRIIARPDARTLQYAPEAILLERTALRTKAEGPLFIPEPVIR